MKKLFLVASAIILNLSVISMVYAGKDDLSCKKEKPKQTVCGFLQQMSDTIISRLNQIDQRLDKLESTIENPPDKVQETIGSFENEEVLKSSLPCYKKSSSSFNEESTPDQDCPSEYKIDSITESINYPQEDGHYVLMLESRSVRVKAVYNPRSNVHDLLEGRIVKVSPIMCDHLTRNGYAEYLGKVGCFLVEFVQDFEFPSSYSKYKGEKYKKGMRYEFDWEKANTLLQKEGIIKIILPS